MWTLFPSFQYRLILVILALSSLPLISHIQHDDAVFLVVQRLFLEAFVLEEKNYLRRVCLRMCVFTTTLPDK